MSYNLENRTVFCHDNLEILRGINSESVDLIYLDPPFNKKKEFTAPTGSSAEGAGFSDIFREEDVKEEWVQSIQEDYVGLSELLDFAQKAEGRTSYNFCYLAYMSIRLVEMHRILKSSASIYLHCDSTMSHYLKLVMDCIFGEINFQNELVWRRATSHNDAKRYGNITDSILFYTKSPNFTWNGSKLKTKRTEEEMRLAYPQKDDRGNFRSENLTGSLHGTSSNVPSTKPWRGYDVYALGRCWSVPKTGDYAKFIETIIPGYSQIEGIHDRLDALDSAGLIYHPKDGVWPGLKRYAQADAGEAPQNLILSPKGFTNFNKGKEYQGYPTQKPIALLEKIIRASSKEGDIVLDPFCGCATTCVASEKLGRIWAGIDVSYKAFELVKIRLSKEIANPDDLFDWDKEITFRTSPPRRTDLGRDYRASKYVYIISHPKYEGEYKVGIASNVEARLNSYQTSDPNREYRLEYSKSTPYFREIELHVHNSLPNKHEWVQATVEEIKDLIESFAPSSK